jgi:hypothetical protein
MSDDNKYKNGKIYTLRNKNDDSLIYVGSTVQPLYKRLSQHKIDSKRTKHENRLLFKKMNETDIINDWYIELYEDCPCVRKEQLTQREGQVIREIGTLNTRIEGRTYKQYYEDNNEKMKEQDKKYYEANKEKNQRRTSEIVFCECGCSVHKDHIARHRRSPKHERIMKELVEVHP